MVEVTRKVPVSESLSPSEPSRLSRIALWNMSFGFLGIQFGWGLQMANGSAIFESLGASPHQLPLLWLAAPVSGLVIQPIVGYASDRVRTPLGRRRPFFLVGAILSSIALVLLPNSPSLWIAAGLLWLLDASANVSMTPFRSFVADLVPAQQQTQGFIVQSLLCGLGAVLSSAMPWLMSGVTWLGVQEDLPLPTFQPGGVPTSIKLSFYIGAALFLSAVLWTVFNTKEAETFPEPVSGAMGKQIWQAVTNMPHTMRRLAWVQCFSWLGLFCMFLYLPPVVAYRFFGGEPGTRLYAEGIEWSGLCLALENLVCCAVALTIYPVVARLGERQTYSLSLASGAVGLISIGWIHQPAVLLIPMVGVGIAVASVHSLPYALLSRAIPPEQNGLYMGIFNCFIVLPEIVAALGLGWVISSLGCDRTAIVVLGGCSMAVAALLAQTVPEAGEESDTTPAEATEGA